MMPIAIVKGLAPNDEFSRPPATPVIILTGNITVTEGMRISQLAARVGAENNAEIIRALHKSGQDSVLGGGDAWLYEGAQVNLSLLIQELSKDSASFGGSGLLATVVSKSIVPASVVEDRPELSDYREVEGEPSIGDYAHADDYFNAHDLWLRDYVKGKSGPESGFKAKDEIKVGCYLGNVVGYDDYTGLYLVKNDAINPAKDPDDVETLGRTFMHSTASGQLGFLSGAADVVEDAVGMQTNAEESVRADIGKTEWRSASELIRP